MTLTLPPIIPCSPLLAHSAFATLVYFPLPSMLSKLQVLVPQLLELPGDGSKATFLTPLSPLLSGAPRGTSLQSTCCIPCPLSLLELTLLRSSPTDIIVHVSPSDMIYIHPKFNIQLSISLTREVPGIRELYPSSQTSNWHTAQCSNKYP